MGPTAAGRIESTLANDPEMAELVAYFCGELGKRVARLEEAVAAGDLATLQTISHQLKGSAPGFGFPDVGRCAGDVESLIRGVTCPDLERIQAATAELVDLCRRAGR